MEIGKTFKVKGLVLLVVCVLAFGCGSSSEDKNLELNHTRAEGNPPGYAAWVANMEQFGRRLCDKDSINSLSTWEGSVWYYDGIKVFQQIAEFTGDSSWLRCADYVKQVYRDYILDNEGRIGGWRVFPHGLHRDYLQTRETLSRRAVQMLAYNSPFSEAGGGSEPELSRETAYLIHAYLLAEDLGISPHPRLNDAVSHAVGHIDSWFKKRSASYLNPFMAALTVESLIHYHERKGGDKQLKEAIRITADWLWNNSWDAANGSFRYIVCFSESKDCPETEEIGSDLNLLIAPMYGWLFKETGDRIYLHRGDTIFERGVSGAWLGSGKQFSQSYRWSFDYVRWRKEGLKRFG
jgi:hypothetical protein